MIEASRAPDGAASASSSPKEVGGKPLVPPGTAVPPRPSVPEEQLRKLDEIAKEAATTMKGKCYHAFKANVLEAGGFGDILTIQLDKRFAKYLEGALQFAEAVEENGAEALGLQKLDGSPAGAPPGTVLVINGGTHGVSKDYGDISVIDKVTDAGNIVCYNDGTMYLPAKDAVTMVKAMYKPLPRPELT